MDMADRGVSLSDIGWRIRTLRMALGYRNASQFAAFVGWSPQLLSNYERGEKRPELTKAIALCNRTGITLDWLYRGERAGLPLDRVAAIDAHLAREHPAGQTQA